MTTANTTLSPNATQISKYFYIPEGGAEGSVGFADSSNSSIEADVFFLYGTFAQVVLDSTFVSLFSANPTNTTDVWQLLWNSELGHNVGLKSTPPANWDIPHFAGVSRKH